MSLYEEACHGWDGEEEVLFDRHPWIIGTAGVASWIAFTILAFCMTY